MKTIEFKNLKLDKKILDKLSLGKELVSYWKANHFNIKYEDFENYITSKGLQLVDRVDNREKIKKEIEDTHFDSLYAAVLYLINLVVKEVESIDPTTSNVVIAGYYCEWLEMCDAILDILENEYIYAEGHSRMEKYVLNPLDCPASRWVFVAGLKKDVIAYPGDDFSYRWPRAAAEICNTENSYTTRDEKEFIQRVVCELSGRDVEIKDVKILDIKDNYISIKIPGHLKGQVIGKGGCRIKAMEKALKKKIKLV